MRGWFLRRKPDRNEKGFSLIEMVIAIPLIALSGGFVVTIIAQSFSIVNDNQAINTAGTEIQNIMDEARNANNCYDLESMEETPKVIKKFESTNSPTDFKITTTATECKHFGTDSKNQVITVTATAKKGADGLGKVLFKNSTSVMISG